MERLPDQVPFNQQAPNCSNAVPRPPVLSWMRGVPVSFPARDDRSLTVGDFPALALRPRDGLNHCRK